MFSPLTSNGLPKTSSNLAGIADIEFLILFLSTNSAKSSLPILAMQFTRGNSSLNLSAMSFKSLSPTSKL